MRITMSIVRDILGEFGVVTGKYYDGGIVVSDVASWSTNSDSTSANVLVAPLGLEREEFSHPERLVVVGGTVLMTEKCALHIPGNRNTSEIVEAIGNGMSKYKLQLNNLEHLALGEADIGFLVNAAHVLLGNPILVLDGAMRVRARTSNEDIGNDFWHSLESTNSLFSKDVGLTGSAKVRNEIRSDEAACNCAVVNGIETCSVRTKEIGGEHLVVILLEKCRPITEADKQVLRFLCSLVELNLKTAIRQGKSSVGYRGLLIDAIEGRVGASDEFATRMRLLGHAAESSARMLIVGPRRGRLSSRQANRLLSDISNTYPFGVGLFYKGRLVFFSVADNDEKIVGADYERFEFFLRRSGAVAAFGEWAPLATTVRSLYKSAVFTFEVGKCVHRERSMHFFEECRSYWPFEICMSLGHPDLFALPKIMDLRENSGESGYALLHVLKCYVDNDGNKSAAASELGIQRNTLQSRLRKIELLLDVSLSDPLEVDYLRWFFRLEEYCDKASWGTHGLGGGR